MLMAAGDAATGFHSRSVEGTGSHGSASAHQVILAILIAAKRTVSNVYDNRNGSVCRCPPQLVADRRTQTHRLTSATLLSSYIV